MAKRKCDICGKEVGTLSQRKLKDGMACFTCMEKIGKEFTEPWVKSFTVGQVSKAVEREIKLIPPQVFQCTNGVLVLDSSNRVMYMGLALGRTSEEIPIDSIVGYTYIEDDKQYGVGHIVCSAAVGGMPFGGAGAVIGSVIGSNPKRKIAHIGVEITYERENTCELFQANIYKGKPIKAEGFTYNGCLETAKSLMGQLDLLMKKPVAASEEQKEAAAQAISGADEIRKYKQLLDEGILTEQEFQAKKSQLLGI